MAALELVPFAMLIADGAGKALAVNQRWIDLTGRSRPDSLGPGWLDALDPDHRHRLRDDVLKVAAGGPSAPPATSDYQLNAPGIPRRRWARWWLSGHELEGVPLVAVAVADVDEDYNRQATLYHLATHDSLTGLVNRSHFMECIEQALRRNQRAARHVGVVYVDLDGFKRVNDRGGHSLGDRVLYAIAARLRHAVRSADMVARIGGDEFAVLCEGLGAADQAEIVARRIATALTESVELDGERWAVAASVGAAVDQGAPDTAEELVDRADQAMYSIKLTRRSDRAPEPEVPAAAAPDPAGMSSDRRAPFDRRAVPGADTRARVSEAGAPVPQPGPGAPEPAPYRPPVSQPPVSQPPVPQPPVPQPTAAQSAGTAHLGNGSTAPQGPAPFPEPAPAPGPVLDRDAAIQAAIAGVAASLGRSSAGAAPGDSYASASQPPAGDDRWPSARDRLADDVLSLRESIDSIRRMLDGLLAGGGGVIDIRESEPQRPPR